MLTPIMHNNFIEEVLENKMKIERMISNSTNTETNLRLFKLDDYNSDENFIETQLNNQFHYNLSSDLEDFQTTRYIIQKKIILNNMINYNLENFINFGSQNSINKFKKLITEFINKSKIEDFEYTFTNDESIFIVIKDYKNYELHFEAFFEDSDEDFENSLIIYSKNEKAKIFSGNIGYILSIINKL
ncbi:MAG: hypothetical protein KDK36_04055 [Leptospiraceae bacterium]|nr:hypothetical protein [Leptospiraceae bacterium]